ncbi:hypothetical protein BDQ17DRAFT_1440616 [Cyathus striatus]|nr:hypothetical protein BDQ17DRAFT_1440616 [Cyathus striatus]
MSRTQKLALFNVDSEQKLGPSIKQGELEDNEEAETLTPISGRHVLPDRKRNPHPGAVDLVRPDEEDNEAETPTPIASRRVLPGRKRNPHPADVDKATKHYEELEDKIKAIEAHGLIFLDKVRDRVTTQQQDQLRAAVEDVMGLSCVTNAVDDDVKSAMTGGVTMDIEGAVQGSNDPEKDDCEVSTKSYGSTVNIGLDLTAYNQAHAILPHDLADNRPISQGCQAGGLNDEDAHSGTYNAPVELVLPQKQRTEFTTFLDDPICQDGDVEEFLESLVACKTGDSLTGHKNEMVSFLDDSLTNSMPFQKQLKRPSTPAQVSSASKVTHTPTPSRKHQARKSSAVPPRLPLASTGWISMACTPKFMAPNNLLAETPLKTESSSSSLSSDASTAKSLPDFIRKHWKKLVVPLLQYNFYISEDPCNISIKGSVLVLTVQTIIDSIVPEHGYKVKEDGCPVYHQAYCHLQEVRSQIGIRVLHVVKKHFKQEEFVTTGPDMIRPYALWALRKPNGFWVRTWAGTLEVANPKRVHAGNGPAIFDDPNPKEIWSGNPEYKKPRDIFGSAFIINTICPFWRSLASMQEGCPAEYPKGLVAMGTAAVEHAFECYITGHFMPPGRFKNELIEEMVCNYIEHAKMLTDRRWRKLAASCGVEFEDSEEPAAMEDMLDETAGLRSNRRLLYKCSSPVPDSSDDDN